VTWFADLSPCKYFSVPGLSDLVAIGWLDRHHDFRRGDVPGGLFAFLSKLLEAPWEPFMFCGFHCCDLCDVEHPPRGVHNLFVPAPRLVYVTPQLVLHYIAVHRYAPPASFQEAVLACPPMGSAEYLEAIRANGPKALFGRSLT